MWEIIRLVGVNKVDGTCGTVYDMLKMVPAGPYMIC